MLPPFAGADHSILFVFADKADALAPLGVPGFVVTATEELVVGFAVPAAFVPTTVNV